ncbi:hemagglutinin repeat-containing protein [Rickettsiales bacterium]|nr:hemagglutinin repeat-containing protein [Rickettsiales bacterium]
MSGIDFNNYYYYDGCAFTNPYANGGCYQARLLLNERIGEAAPASFINSGQNITISSNKLNNDGGQILAQENITINSDILTNTSYDFSEYVDVWWKSDNFPWHHKVLNWAHPHGIPSHHSPYIYADENGNAKGGSFYSGTFGGYTIKNSLIINSNIKSGKNLYGSIADKIDNNLITEGDNNIKSITDRNAQIVNGLDISNILDTGKVEKDLSSYINGPDNQGMFQKSTNPNGPLFETRSQFVDQSKFFGSDYFYQKIGLNLTDVQTEFEQQNKRLVGDEFFQTKIIEEQLKTIRKNALLLSDSGTNVNTEIQSLLDNAADEYARLGLTANETLTQSQIDNLQKDIVWFETQTINGELYVVPKIYLTKATRDSLNNNGSFTTKSTLMAMGDLQLDSNSLVNSGSIVGNNVAISTTNDITNNNFSEVIATNGLNLTSNSGSIVNFSKLKAGGAVSLTAANNITNTSTVKTNAANLLDSDNPAYISNGSAASNSGNISSTLFETAVIEAGSFTANAGNDFSNYGANITTASGDLNITAGDDIRIETIELRNRSEYRSKKYTKITDTTTNTSSNITSAGGATLTTNGSGTDNEAGTSDLGVGSSILVSGSNVSAANDLNLNANNNAIITNAVNKDYSFEQRTKKGSIKTSRTSRTDYVETAVNSNLTGENVNITTNNNIYVQGSDLNSNFDTATNTGGNTNLNATNDTTITNAILQEYHYTTKEVSNRGVFKGVTAITSAVIDIVTLPINLTIAVASPVLKNIDDPLQKALDPIAPDFVTDNLDYDKLRNRYKDAAYNNQYHNTKIKTTTNNDLVNIVASNVNAGNNLAITSTNNTTVQASNLNSGTADTAGTNSNVTGSTTINTNNLNILAAANYNQTTVKQRTSKTMAIRNNTTGDMVTNYTNSNLTAKNDGFTFNVTNQADIRAKDLTDPSISESSYVTAIKAQVASDKISETNLAIANKHWEDTNRELTEAGTATIAIAAVAATIVTGGAALGVVGTAVAATAAATASTTAASTSMNADGDVWKQAKTISKDTWDATTSREAFENYAIAAGTALLTAGLMDVTGLNEVGNAANSTANGANAATTTTTSTASATTSTTAATTTSAATATTTSTTVAASNPSIYMQAGKALAESAISTVSSTAAQASVKGISFSDAIKEQGTNILVGAVANVGAKHIGVNYKTSAGTGVDKAIQLTSHAALGAGVSALTGNDALSGAVSAVVGEVAGEAVLNNFDVSKAAIKEIAGLAGGYSAIFTGNAIGLSDSEVSDNMFSGQRIGKNAAENNLLYAAARDLKGVPIGTHQFSILAPDNPEDFTPELLSEIGAPPMQDLGDGTMGWVVGAHNRADASGEFNLLLAEFNENADFTATKQFFDPKNNIKWYKSDYDTEAHIVNHPGLTDTQLITNVLQNTVNYQNNMVSIPYPKPISTISDDSIINSNSWNQSILKHSGATGYPNNFKGADLGTQNSLIKQYFEPKNE